MTLRNSTGLPEGRFSGHERLLASLRGIFMANRDHSDPRTPRNIRETLRKPRSQVPRSPPANGLRSGTASQRTRTRQRLTETSTTMHNGAIGEWGHSTPL
ncbi:hypothetical protein CRG98_008686 [Punica granatum]|uniref:Uncharacterized protein n=1 Tax=Punica granatum TaxID=22663 RepID=A0A2I0KRQ2_PUNGR|nr:hypothetical protein CRG98_008686 [Punica granatum]